MAAGTPAFHFEHAESHKPLAWPKYKLKECWTLVLCLLALRRLTGPVILHNWRGGSAMKFTRAFHEGAAWRADDRLAVAPLVDPFACGAMLRGLALLLAALLALLPVTAILTVARHCFPRTIGPLAVYCDGHLSGFALVLAAQAQGSLTMTLHHGLYRLDDRGSLMGIRNFVADLICLWDVPTEQMFRDAGTDPERLLRVGAYGFGGEDTTDAVKPDRILFCPPYDAARVAVFKALEPRLPENSESLWSLHPMLRADHPHLTQAAIASVSPRPALAICGDSGVLMDALAREIPIITIADRSLAQTHLGFDEVRALTPEALAALMVQARAALNADRARFGFDPLPQETGLMLSGRKILWGLNAVGLRLRGTKIAFPGMIGPTTFLLGRRNIRIGKRVRIWPGARIEVFDGATLTIEDNVVIGANCHITIAADLTIGEGSNFTGVNAITNITHELKDMHLPSHDRPWKVEPVILGKRLFVGHGAKILPGCTLRDGCVLGANTVAANLDAPENSVIVGMPGKLKRIVIE